MLFLIPDGQLRPNMLEDKKNEEYHLKFGRYCVGQANNQLQVDFMENIRINKNFYARRQWTFDEDLDAFFKDDTGQSRNRLKIINNIIRPIVENYRGNAIRMKINARAKSVSPKAITRREQILDKMRFFTGVANEEGNPFSEDLKKRLPIGKDDSETEAIFDNLYIDSYVETINDLLIYVSERNRFESKQLRIAEDMALCGMSVMKDEEYGGHQDFNFIEPENFFWDRTGKEYDLSDSEFMGECYYRTESEIFEECQSLTMDERKSIESYCRQFNRSNMGMASANGNTVTERKFETGGRIPEFYVKWRDTEKYEYGYVRDEFGYPYLTKINFIEEGEDKAKYTDEDLITVDTVRSRQVLGGQKKKTIYVDILRYINFIPKEILATVDSTNKEGLADIIMDWGIEPYQETENLEVSNVKFPYKCYCWGYLNGEVLSPVDDAISPQRMINRILSVAENQINNSRGSGTFYDKSMIDPAGGEDEMLRNMNQSKPVGIRANGRGIQNAVSQYDSTVKQGTMVLFNIIDIMGNMTQKMTGVNEAIKGESTGSDQLVGVTQLMIQRGSLMQEPFYNAVSEVFLQCYQSIATRGKRIYADNERELAMAVGDNGAKIIKITKDMKTEDFRVFVKRENPEEAMVQAGDQMLLQFLQLQLIDKDMFSSLYGRSTPDQISAALRKKAKDDREVMRMQQEATEKQNAEVSQQVQQEKGQQEMMMHEQIARDDIKDLQDKKFKMKEIFAKQLGSLAKTNPAAQKQILDQTKNLESNVV